MYWNKSKKYISWARHFLKLRNQIGTIRRFISCTSKAFSSQSCLLDTWFQLVLGNRWTTSDHFGEIIFISKAKWSFSLRKLRYVFEILVECFRTSNLNLLLYYGFGSLNRLLCENLNASLDGELFVWWLRTVSWLIVENVFIINCNNFINVINNKKKLLSKSKMIIHKIQR